MKIKDERANRAGQIEAPTTTEGAVASGRSLVSRALEKKISSERCAALLEASRKFQRAIQMNPAAEDAYAWLAHALRLLGQEVHASAAGAGDPFLKYACAVAWQARSTTAPASISGRTRQETKILVAWLRATRHFSPDAAEAEMETLRARYLSEALDPAAINRVYGELRLGT
jgi:hypothetical protein